MAASGFHPRPSGNSPPGEAVSLKSGLAPTMNSSLMISPGMSIIPAIRCSRSGVNFRINSASTIWPVMSGVVLRLL